MRVIPHFACIHASEYTRTYLYQNMLSVHIRLSSVRAGNATFRVESATGVRTHCPRSPAWLSGMVWLLLVGSLKL